MYLNKENKLTYFYFGKYFSNHHLNVQISVLIVTGFEKQWYIEGCLSINLSDI